MLIANRNEKGGLYSQTQEFILFDVKTKPLSKIAEKDCMIEGLVGRTIKELKDRNGNRIIVKIKVKDFE